MPTFFIKKKDKVTHPFSKFQGRSYVNYDKDLFQTDIKRHHLWYDYWENGDNDPEKLWGIILEIIIEVADQHCPLKDMKF